MFSMNVCLFLTIQNVLINIYFESVLLLFYPGIIFPVEHEGSVLLLDLWDFDLYVSWKIFFLP